MSDDEIELSERQKKAVDIASRYVEVLIGLASGIITVILAFFENITTIGIEPSGLKVGIIFFGISIFGGLMGLGGLVNTTSSSKIKKPTNPLRVRMPTIIQLVAFGLGISILIIILPS